MSLLSRIADRLATYRRGALWAAAAIVLIWVAFFDSHSLLSRLQWHREKAKLQTENAELKADISALEQRLRQPLTDAEIERIAREEYGMSRDDETVYPVREDD